MIRKGEPLRKYYKTKKPSSKLVVFSYLNTCGESRIRTCEDVISGFTVRPRWPLEYLPIAFSDCKYKNTFELHKQKGHIIE
jgi:hypothetical protein